MHTGAWTARAGTYDLIVALPKTLVWAQDQVPLPKTKLYRRDGFNIFPQNLPYSKIPGLPFGKLIQMDDLLRFSIY